MLRISVTQRVSCVSRRRWSPHRGRARTDFVRREVGVEQSVGVEHVHRLHPSTRRPREHLHLPAQHVFRVELERRKPLRQHVSTAARPLQRSRVGRHFSVRSVRCDYIRKQTCTIQRRITERHCLSVLTDRSSVHTALETKSPQLHRRLTDTKRLPPLLLGHLIRSTRFQIRERILRLSQPSAVDEGVTCTYVCDRPGVTDGKEQCRACAAERVDDGTARAATGAPRP